MIRAPLSTTSVVDEAAEVVSMTATPWAAVMIAAAMPYRFLQIVFLDQLFEVGGEASHYGNLLGGTANLIVATVVLALWGRALYARACRLAMERGQAPGRETWRVPPAALASYLLTASTAMLLGYASLFTVLGFIAAAVFGGVATGTIELNERVSLTAPFGHILRHAKHLRIPIALAFVFFCAVFVALMNLLAAFSLAAGLANAIGGFDAPEWHVLFSMENRRFVLMLFAGAVMIVEPFWVAAHVVYVRKAGAEESGTDLRASFEELQRAS